MRIILFFFVFANVVIFSRCNAATDDISPCDDDTDDDVNLKNLNDDTSETENINISSSDGKPKTSKKEVPQDAAAISDNIISSSPKVAERKSLEKRLEAKRRVVDPTSRISDPSVINSKDDGPLVKKLENSQLAVDGTKEQEFQKSRLTNEDQALGMAAISPATSESTSAAKEACESLQPRPICDRHAKYRTADGSCNNLARPNWGARFVCQQRLMPAYYEGDSEFRKSVTGHPLPPPRILSQSLHYPRLMHTNFVNHLYMFFGQLLDHDIAFTPVSTSVSNKGIQCCPPSPETHPQCAPILIPPNDPFYSKFGKTCLNFVRSAICPTCKEGSRQMFNQITTFIDASFVYGSSDNQTMSLRTNDGTGRLRVQKSKHGDLPPASPNPNTDQCSFPETNDICFVTGDARANQHTVLISLHTVFLSEHNRIAQILESMNRSWDDERIFQETRRIISAQMQAIVYKEYLPITIGSDLMQFFDLSLLKGCQKTKYNPDINPTLILEFSTAAFRFGHSMIHSVVSRTPLNSTNGLRYLRNEFFQPFDIYNGVIGPLLSGVCNSPADKFDAHLAEDVNNFLYKIRGNPTGLDLASTNINRGRDHGVPPFVEMLNWCTNGKIKIREFYDLVRYKVMRLKEAEALNRHYRNVADIDLWVGILMEIPLDGAVVGITGACIIGIQFHKMKFGDRFYFEHGNQKGSFTCKQLDELRKVTLSEIMCLNTNAKHFPRHSFLFPSKRNIIKCRNVKGVDLRYWRE